MYQEVQNVLLSEPLQDKCHGVLLETTENGHLYFMKTAKSKTPMNAQWYLMWFSDQYTWDDEYWISNEGIDTHDKIIEIFNNNFQPSDQVPIVSLKPNYKIVYDIGDIDHYKIVDKANTVLFSN